MYLSIKSRNKAHSHVILYDMWAHLILQIVWLASNYSSLLPITTNLFLFIYFDPCPYYFTRISTASL